MSRTITVRPTTPWHTNDLTEAKGALRRAERLWRNSSLTVHRQIFKDRRNIFRKLLKTARSDYYRSEISKAGGNMRLIYGITDSLLGRKVNMTLQWQTNDHRYSLPDSNDISKTRQKCCARIDLRCQLTIRQQLWVRTSTCSSMRHLPM